MYHEIINFWFEEIEQKSWWVKDDVFDELIRSRFGDLHAQAASGELADWRTTALGRLAEIIILDQFSRNMYRDTSKAFSYDSMALTLAQEAVAGGFDAQLSTAGKSFIYMPYMHSESLHIHQEAECLFLKLGIESTIEFERKHRDIIERFGRYPHRNKILNRESSEDEIIFLSLPNSSF